MDYLLYFLSIITLTFWMTIWIMHICALTNAKIKLNKKSYTSAASKRKRKLKHLKEKYLPFMIKTTTTTTTTNSFNSTGNSINRKLMTQLTNDLDLICCHQQQGAAAAAAVANNNLTPAKFFPDRNQNRKQLEITNNIISPHESLIEFQEEKEQLYSKPTEKLVDCCNENNDYYSPTTIEQASKNNSYYFNNFSYNINLPLAGVSIIKPLVGVDSNLHQNLETFFRMDYPTYEILFCVQEPDDAAILIVKNLFQLYPHVDAKLFIGGSRVGVNPKINNMQPAYEVAKYELILISDSCISMKRDTLLDMVGHMREDIALVHQMPFVCDGRQGFQSAFEKVYFGTVHARAYLFADLVNINCPTGMSALMRKNLLDEVGGIKAFGQYLAEDFFFAKSFTNRGWKISISSQPAWQNSANSSDTLSTLNSRIQRWVKLRFAMVPQWTLLEPFSECLVLGLLGATSINFLWPPLNPIAIFLFHVLLWFLFDYKLLCTIQDGALALSYREFVIAWLIRECTALLVFLKALTDPRVTWRSRSFKLKWGGYAEEIIT